MSANQIKHKYYNRKPMEYDLAMKRQNANSGFHKTVGAMKTGTYFCSPGLGIFLYPKQLITTSYLTFSSL